MKNRLVVFFHFDYMRGALIDEIQISPKDFSVWVDTYYKVCRCEDKEEAHEI